MSDGLYGAAGILSIVACSLAVAFATGLLARGIYEALSAGWGLFG